MKRRFLFLQGVCSPFFALLGDALKAQGHQVFKVNFTGGDAVYWKGRPAYAFRDSIAELPVFLDDIFRRDDITDILLFGDCRSVHQVAVSGAKQHGIRIHVCEEGYFRPYWITLERDGVNGRSLLPRNPHWYRNVARDLPDYGDGQPFRSSFFIRAFHDVHYHIGSAINPLLYRGYRTHATVTAPREYAGYIRRLPLLRFYKEKNQSDIGQLIATKTPFYFLPLQLNGDAQIRVYSDFTDMEAVIRHVMTSFAQSAPEGTHLVIKNHPLDMWDINYAKLVRQLSAQLSLEGRVLYLETGDIGTLLKHARGVVTVNSTVGLQALTEGCPVYTLADPIYNFAGMTSQQPLGAFWQQPDEPDMDIVRAFRKVVIHTTQINGGLYSKEGIGVAIQNMIPVLTSDVSPLEALL